jgi:hypothetical protein
MGVDPHLLDLAGTSRQWVRIPASQWFKLRIITDIAM